MGTRVTGTKREVAQILLMPHGWDKGEQEAHGLHCTILYCFSDAAAVVSLYVVPLCALCHGWDQGELGR